MSSSATSHIRTIFPYIKYLVYLLLSFNVYLFLNEELSALQHTFIDGFSPAQIIQVFSATIDTGAWVLLLLLFELETYVLDDRQIYGWRKAALHGIRGICYVAIIYAFTGYVAELLMLYNTVAMDVAALCAASLEGWSLLVGLDEYVALDHAACGNLDSTARQLAGFNIVADDEVLSAARYNAWTDVVNSGTWLLVVFILEFEVRLQLKRDLSDQFMQSMKYVKFFLYAVLFGAAAFWGYAGEFLDFWDACLWLFAFVFIELNVFEWQQETRQRRKRSSG